MKWIYIISAIISLYETMLFLETKKQKYNASQILLFFSSIVANYGYCIIACATSVGVALIGVQCYNIGGIFSILCLLFVIANFCQIKYIKSVRIIMIVIALAIEGILITNYYTNLYYTHVTLVYSQNFSYLIKTNGTLHFIFSLYIITCVILAFLIVIYSIYKKTKISIKTVTGILAILSLSAISFIIRGFVNIHIDPVPFVFTINLGILLKLMQKVNLYDIESNLLNAFERRYGYGYITFDTDKRFMGCNDFAKKVFPELNELVIDEHVKPSDSVFYNELFKWFLSWTEDYNSEQIFETKNISVICSITTLKKQKNIGYLIELRDETKQQEFLHLITDYNYKLQDKVESKTQQIIQMQNSIITGMASMVESRDNSTGGHINRTSECIKVFIKILKENDSYKDLDDNFYDNLIKAAPMHDLGKIAIPDNILRKPERFTQEEFEEMKMHSQEGARIVQNVLKEVDDEELKKVVTNVAHYHHERWDGTGYPKKLKGKEIPLEARIMTLVDVFDALVSKRCYKEAYSFEKAKTIMESSLGEMFDPELGKVFINSWDEFVTLYKTMKIN